ncbi:MAG: hypothetical protein ACK4MD_05225 [Demequina sp.]
MAVTPLTDAQVASVNALADARRLSPVPADWRRATPFLGHAADALKDLPHLTKDTIRYTLA